MTHDADGNLTGDGRWTYSWDSENRLITMQTTSNALSSGVPNVKLAYAYDGQSRRIGKTVYTNAAGSWVQASDSTFVYDGWAMIHEVGRAVPGEPGVTNSYVYGLDLSGSPQGAGTVGGLLFRSKVCGLMSNVCHYAYDGNGNVMVLVDAATGNESARYEYGPFGEVIRKSGAMAQENPFRFSTKYEDAETGLLYYGYRYYAPGVGRWVNRDPIGEKGGCNVLVLCMNDDVNAVDALGDIPLRLVHVYSGNPRTEVFDEDDITIENSNQNGGGFFGNLPGVWAEDEGDKKRICNASIIVGIKINSNAPNDWSGVPSGVTKFGYFKHTNSGDGQGLIGGHNASGAVVDNSVPTTVLSAHERGHAKTLFQYVNNINTVLDQLNGLIPVGVNPFQFVWGFLNTDQYKIDSARTANIATINAMSSNSGLSQDWPTSQTSSSNGETTTIGQTTYHYVWKVVTP